MLSKKMTVSLMSLIIILALAFAVPSAMAQKEFKTTVTQRGTLQYTAGTPGTLDTDAITVDLDIEFAKPVGALDFDGDDANIVVAHELDKDGIKVSSATATAIAEDATYSMRSGTKRRITVTLTPEAPTATPGMGLVAKLIIQVKSIMSTDTSLAAKDKANMSKEVYHTITLVQPIPENASRPKVVSIQRLRPGSQTVVAAFQEAEVTGAFDVRIVLTEKAFKPGTGDAINAADIEVANGTASNWVVGVPFAEVIVGTANSGAGSTLRPHPSEGMYEYVSTAAPTLGLPALGGTPADFVPGPTGSDNMYHQYRVTITPHRRVNTVNVSLKEFHDNASPFPNTYKPFDIGNKANGREQLRLKVAKVTPDLTAGYKVTIPKDWIIPAGGYLVIAQNVAGSEVEAGPGPAGAWRTNDTPRASHRTPAQRKYNVIGMDTLPNLATQFLDGVVVDVQSQHAGLVISEVMWGEDVSLATPSNSQYIELYNPGAQYKTVADDVGTPDKNEALTLIFYGSNEFASVPAKNADGTLPAGITDRIGTLGATGAYWSPTNKGQSGRSGTTAGEERTGRGVVVDPVPIVSMYRTMAAGAVEDGQMATSWMSSAGPKSANFDLRAIGVRHGTPGAATDATDTGEAAQAAADKAKADEATATAAAEKLRTTGTIPTEGQIYISEIMVAGGGVLPQWIEIANGSKSEENLSGWTLTIDNAVADADVSIGASATFTIPDGTMIGAFGQQSSASTILVVTEAGRNNVDGSGQVINLKKDNEVELILAGVTTRKYTLLSDMAFLITLAPPKPAATKPPAGETQAAKATRMAAEKKDAAMRMEATDMAGNLGADGAAAWALPISEDGRSSLIRRHVQVRVGPAEPEDGMMMDSWVLASDTSFAQPTHIRTQTYYGAMNDVGTPGFRAGGALPVELSHFRPERKKDTGAVVITWSTQSELNNAGFFIKRSNQKDGEFTVINATMIAGAGTTSEKQFYTYTDTTAQPNVVYYYQIEDVSLDGHRQTLTRGIRLKGHVGAAGKATVLWGELKESQ